MIKLSSEQRLFVEKAKEGNNILVDACIGSGKTTAIQMLCKELPKDKKILYLTYNKLLKIDAKSKIKEKNVLVTNYHGFAYTWLIRQGIKSGISDLIQVFLKEKPPIPKYDVLIIDEYQDIEQELAELLEYIKDNCENIQVIAVGDMQQKIYDKTTLKISEFMNSFLDKHIMLEFTQCFRLSSDLAAMLGRIWNKKIVGVNDKCIVSKMKKDDVVDFLSRQEPKNVLCLGSRNKELAQTLNMLEENYPEIYNKKTVYATISDSDSLGITEPKKDSAIFTTFDSSKGLERKILVVFDFTESYWFYRMENPMQAYEILRNIFCVAASRGKEQIIFVDYGMDNLSEETLVTDLDQNDKLNNMEISEMFDFKYVEDIEECFALIKTKKLEVDDDSSIDVNNRDELIDLSPCIGIYQEANYFNGYNIDDAIEFRLITRPDKKILYTDDVKQSKADKKVLFLTALETSQNRYFNQVDIPYITDAENIEICNRLSTIFSKDEVVQKACCLPFSNKKSGELIFYSMGMTDVVKDNIVYELKFVSELTHVHFLQCASYVVALELKKGILWNVRDNTMYEITIPNKKKFLDAVTNAITKNKITKYYRPAKKHLKAVDGLVKNYNERR